MSMDQIEIIITSAIILAVVIAAPFFIFPTQK